MNKKFFLIALALKLIIISIHAYSFNVDYSKACYAAQQGDYENAKKKLESLITSNPAAPDLLYDAGVICAKMNEFAPAKGYFQACSNLIATPSELKQKSLFNLANMHVELNELKEAVDAYQQVLTENPYDEKAIYNKKIIEDLLKKQKEEQEDNKQQDKDESENNKNDSQQKDTDQNSEEDKKNNSDQNSQNNAPQDQQNSEKNQQDDQSNNKEKKQSDTNNSTDSKKNNSNDKQESLKQNSDLKNNKQEEKKPEANPFNDKDLNPWKQPKNQKREEKSSQDQGAGQEKNAKVDGNAAQRTQSDKAHEDKNRQKKNGFQATESNVKTPQDKQLEAYLNQVDDYDSQRQKAIIQRALSNNSDESSYKVGW